MAGKRLLILAYLTRVVVVVLLLAVSVGLYMVLMSTSETLSPTDAAEDPRPIRVFSATTVPVRRQFVGYGTAQALVTADVPAEVGGLVEAIDEGTASGRAVDRGQLLVTLDGGDLESRVERLQEEVRQIDAQIERVDIQKASAARRLELLGDEVEIARRDLARVRRLNESGNGTEVELDNALERLRVVERLFATTESEVNSFGPQRLQLQAQRAALEADLRVAQRDIERTTIEAPIEGILDDVLVEQGERVSPGETVAYIVDLRRIEIPIRVPASARGVISVGDEARIVQAGPNPMQWSGQVLRIGPTTDVQTRTFPAYIEVLQSMDARVLLAPGTFVEGTILTSQTSERMVVPRRAVTNGEVMVVRDGMVDRERIVVDYYVRDQFDALAIPGENYWAVLVEPLEEGTQVVLNGTTDLALGERVRPIPVSSEKRSAIARDGGAPGAGADGN